MDKIIDKKLHFNIKNNTIKFDLEYYIYKLLYFIINNVLSKNIFPNKIIK